METLDTTVDWINSYYLFVRNNLLQINPDRQFGGIIQAQSWPPKSAKFETFYLMTGEQNPTPNVGSWYSPAYTEGIQWIWQIQGTDSETVFAANRSDRYSKFRLMCQELLTASYPGYCENMQWVAQAPTPGAAPVSVGTPFQPKQMLWFFKPPRFIDSFSSGDGGILKAAAIVDVTSFSSALEI